MSQDSWKNQGITYEHKQYTALVLGIKALSDILKKYCIHKMTL